MGQFFVFIAVLVVIWTLSAIATAVNKQKELERRRQMQERTPRGTRTAPMPMPDIARQISEGIAARFPDVLLAPSPPPARQANRTRPPKFSGPKRRQSARVAAPPLPLQQEPVARAPAPLMPPPPQALRPTPHGVDAPTISHWLKPSTLRRQFILTEIFQPPVALRE